RGRIEGVERDRDQMAVGHRKDHEENAEGNDDQRGEEFSHDHLPSESRPGVMPFPAGPASLAVRRLGQRKTLQLPASPDTGSRFSRSRISLPVLKNGTLFWSTGTWAPVRGLRPARAGRCLTEKAPKPRSSTRSPRAKAATISSRIALTMFSTSLW